MRFSELLMVPYGITALVGGGGKTSLLLRLGRELSEDCRVLMTTTTHIRMPACTTLLSPDRAAVTAAFLSENLVAAGDPADDGKLSAPTKLDMPWDKLADYVLVEADGSRGLPLKAPAEHEPVLPPDTALVIAVAGMSCVNRTLRYAAHRPERYATLTGLQLDEYITPEAVAKGLSDANGQRKGVTGAYRVVLNQADTPERFAFARTVARMLDEEVVIAALQTRPDWAEGWSHGRCVR